MYFMHKEIVFNSISLLLKLNEVLRRISFQISPVCPSVTTCQLAVFAPNERDTTWP